MYKKVYCENCEHYFWQGGKLGFGGYQPMAHLCRQPKFINKTDTCIKQVISYAYCYTKNKDNNCAYYKRVWWKFWVK